MVLNGLPDLYGLKYDSATACGLLLYLCSYKLDGFVTMATKRYRKNNISQILNSEGTMVSDH